MMRNDVYIVGSEWISVGQKNRLYELYGYCKLYLLRSEMRTDERKRLEQVSAGVCISWCKVRKYAGWNSVFIQDSTINHYYGILCKIPPPEEVITVCVKKILCI